MKELSRQVGQAKKAGDEARAEELRRPEPALGEDERAAAAEADAAEERLRTGLLYLPNIPADGCTGRDGRGGQRRGPPLVAGPGRGTAGARPGGAPAGAALGDRRGPAAPRHGARGAAGRVHVPALPRAGCPVCCGPSPRSPSIVTPPDYEEIRPPTVVLTETMTSTGHLPKFADDAYHVERDDLWLIPTAEVPLTSMHRGEILEESQLPLRFTASTACYRREAGSAGRDTRGLLRVHEFDKVELFAYATPDGALDAQADILRRAESMLQELELRYRVLDLCTGDLSGSSARTFDLEAYCARGRPLARGELGQLVPRLPGPPGQRALPPGRGRPAAARAHRERLGVGLAADVGGARGERTAARRDASCCPKCLAPYLGGELLLKAP